MKKLIPMLLIIQFFSCSDDENMSQDHQIGNWEGIKMVVRLTEESDTISNDTSLLNIILNEDLSGMYNDKQIINWEKSYNSQINREQITIKLENNSSIFTQIFIDELDYQEWADFSIFQGTFEKQHVYYELERQ